MSGSNKTLFKLSLAAGAVGAYVIYKRITEVPQPVFPSVSQLPKTALITGASSGIGAEYARQLAALGYNLVLVARREERLNALAAELQQKHNIQVEILAADLANPSAVAKVEQRIRELDSFTMLVNNAGFSTYQPFVQAKLSRELNMIDVNIVAAVRLTYAALPGMVNRGYGHIVNIASVAAFVPSPDFATYSATKSFVKSFSQSLQAEMQGKGVQVQALCPGFTITEFHETPDFSNFERSQFPKALWMTPNDVVAESLAALGRDQVIVVPGMMNKILIQMVQLPLLGNLLLGILTRNL